MIQLNVEVKNFMKVNAKLFDRVVTDPFDLQELNDGATVELHSLNQNEELFNEYAPKAKFAIWACKNGKNYRLLVEDGYYAEMRELYGKRVNQTWVSFWDEVEKGRGKIMKMFFIPLTIIVFIAITLLMIFNDKLGENGQLIAMAVVLIVFVISNVIINRKIDNIIQTSNANAVEKIKNIVGHKHFDELMEAQRVYYDKFFGIEEDETEETPTEEVSEETEEKTEQ